MVFPDRMNAYNTITGRFMRWLKGHNNPVHKSLGDAVGLSPGWFLHKNMFLNWSEDGYFEMSRKDSDKFNARYNKGFGIDAIKSASLDGKETRTRSESSESQDIRQKLKQSFQYFSDSSEAADDRFTEIQKRADSQPPMQSAASTLEAQMLPNITMATDPCGNIGRRSMVPPFPNYVFDSATNKLGSQEVRLPTAADPSPIKSSASATTADASIPTDDDPVGRLLSDFYCETGQEPPPTHKPQVKPPVPPVPAAPAIKILNKTALQNLLHKRPSSASTTAGNAISIVSVATQSTARVARRRSSDESSTSSVQYVSGPPHSFATTTTNTSAFETTRTAGLKRKEPPVPPPPPKYGWNRSKSRLQDQGQHRYFHQQLTSADYRTHSQVTHPEPDTELFLPFSRSPSPPSPVSESTHTPVSEASTPVKESSSTGTRVDLSSAARAPRTTLPVHALLKTCAFVSTSAVDNAPSNSQKDGGSDRSTSTRSSSVRHKHRRHSASPSSSSHHRGSKHQRPHGAEDRRRCRHGDHSGGREHSSQGSKSRGPSHHHSSSSSKPKKRTAGSAANRHHQSPDDDKHTTTITPKERSHRSSDNKSRKRTVQLSSPLKHPEGRLAVGDFLRIIHGDYKGNTAVVSGVASTDTQSATPGACKVYLRHLDITVVVPSDCLVLRESSVKLLQPPDPPTLLHPENRLAIGDTVRVTQGDYQEHTGVICGVALVGSGASDDHPGAYKLHLYELHVTVMLPSDSLVVKTP